MSSRPGVSKEARFAILVGALALFFSTLPYLAGYAAQTPERIFDGALFAPVDYFSHLAKMQQGLRGEWTYRLLHTSEDQAGGLVQTFYVALGHAARWTGLSLPLVYQLARWITGGLFFFAVYRFLDAFRPSRRVRRSAYALVAFSSGLGWLVQMVAPSGLGGVSPIDFWLVDAYSFFGLFMFPHFNLVVALLLVLFTRFIRLLEPGLDPAPHSAAGLRLPLAGTGLLALVLTFVHPYSIVVLLATVVAYGIIRAARHRHLPRGWWAVTGAACAGALPVFLYSAVVFLTDPAFRLWGVQLDMPSPPPIHYVLGYGLLLLLALIGLRRFVDKAGDRAAFVLTWIAVAALLAYAPVGIQRRLIEGLHVALCLVAAYGLDAAADRLRPRARLVFVVMTIVIASASNVYMIIGYTADALNGDRRFFHSGDLAAAMDWLAARTAWTDTVLASERVGGILPAVTGHRVVLGHWIETLHYRERQRDVAAFFDAATPNADRIAVLDDLGVKYVIHGEAERALGDFDPAAANFLQPVYHSGGVNVYQVEMP